MAKWLKELKGKKWFQGLMTVAPKIGAALGGPWAFLALEAVNAALGSDFKNEAELAAAIDRDPSLLLKMKEAEHALELRMRELDLEEQDLYLKDVQSARQREMAVKDKMPQVLALLAVALFAGLATAIFFVRDLPVVVDESQRELLFYLLATAQAAFLQGYNYYLGSSRGSARKTDAFSSYLERDVKITN